MSDVKRYQSTNGQMEIDGHVVPVPLSPAFVEYADYATLEAKLAEANQTEYVVKEQVTELQYQLATLREECRWAMEKVIYWQQAAIDDPGEVDTKRAQAWLAANDEPKEAR